MFWSDELFDILDFPRGRMPPLTDALALYPEPWRDRIVSAIRACSQDGTAFDLEAEILTARGARKWVRVSAEAERHVDGSITRIQGAFQDITARKQLEQQYLRAQRMESIGTLAGGIAHDLNNVLAPILLSIGLLQQDEHDAERLDTLATIRALRPAKGAVVLTDMMMPLMDGTATILELVRLNPEVRIIGTSGLATEVPAASAAGERVMSFLPKPYTAETLLAAIRAALPPVPGSESELLAGGAA